MLLRILTFVFLSETTYDIWCYTWNIEIFVKDELSIQKHAHQHCGSFLDVNIF